MCLGLHLVSLVHGQQSVEILRLRADIVKQTRRKYLWILKTRDGRTEYRIKNCLTFETKSRKVEGKT